MSLITPDVSWEVLTNDEIEREWDKIYDFAGSSVMQGTVNVETIDNDPTAGVYRVIRDTTV